MPGKDNKKEETGSGNISEPVFLIKPLTDSSESVFYLQRCRKHLRNRRFFVSASELFKLCISAILCSHYF
ncbi:MAG TPA: hypothetical protein DEQ64_16905 [Lachnoclostridium sp.]|nr:hypothetical protein [Lachnoclostridium sp.]